MEHYSNQSGKFLKHESGDDLNAGTIRDDWKRGVLF